MTHRLITAALATLALAPGLAAHAQTTFTQKTLSIAGARDIDATAINAHGAIVATVFDSGDGTPSGVVLYGKKVTPLPAPYQGAGAAMPQAINDRGDVLGYAYEGIQPHLFLWRDGQYDPADDVTLVIEQQQGPPPLPIGLNHRDAVFYTIITGQMNPTDPIYGKLPKVRSMPYLLRYQTAHGLNADGLLAGTTFYESASEVFVGKGKTFTELLPAGAVKSSGGFLNDDGEVAGVWTDSGNTQHGFTWLNGTYTSFELPEAAQAYSAAVTGINNAGRVVGVYTSQATGQQHAFLYNGKTATAFGDYSGQDLVSAAINDVGTILVSRQIKQETANYVSYRVTCAGSGC
jgi:probable HAF family extracellular repeat protein